MSHLKMTPSIGAIANYKARRYVERLFLIPGFPKAVEALDSIITHLKNIERAGRQTREFASKAHSNNAQNFDSGYGYDSEFQEVVTANYYRQQIENGLVDTKIESGEVYRKSLDIISSILQKGEIKKLLNFGVSYGYIDNILADKFPDIHFTGIDRSRFTKFYNEQFFDLPNLSFMAGDIFDCLNNDWQDSLLLHIRTLTCLPQDFVERLYKRAAASGMRYIVGVEQCGISWQTGKPYEFSMEEQPSVVFRNYMFIHNYPAILQSAGYTLEHAELLKTNHPDPNYRLIMFAAKLDLDNISQ